MKVTDLSRVSTITQASSIGSCGPETRPANAEFFNSDIHMAPPPRMTQPRPPIMPTIPERPAAPEVIKFPLWRKVCIGAALALSVGGTIGGIVSIVVLGPIGLAVAAGTITAGLVLAKLATR